MPQAWGPLHSSALPGPDPPAWAWVVEAGLGTCRCPPGPQSLPLLAVGHKTPDHRGLQSQRQQPDPGREVVGGSKARVTGLPVDHWGQWGARVSILPVQGRKGGCEPGCPVTAPGSAALPAVPRGPRPVPEGLRPLPGAPVVFCTCLFPGRLGGLRQHRGGCPRPGEAPAYSPASSQALVPGRPHRGVRLSRTLS